MMIHFSQHQLEKFNCLVQKIKDQPEHYLCFDSVSDFYQAKWLDDFPQGTNWYVTGLDDGAEEFYVLIEYKNHYLKIQKTSETIVSLGVYEDADGI
ncbi:hypothetical protein B9T31_09260 [Acinetobacter sp. ANC 4558]|uniref:hypothetical protein n=1 Tax=Acinetobacter sp. ANC 4558 TaxID=1977876 RepID=UPI000A35559F|nr:hypothetical protein [Acinetobacter sp. ANC 4558]OTG86213.1 hypothetical protein B9T31_09260 [Acinetobacter sp. ANC 4558]